MGVFQVCPMGAKRPREIGRCSQEARTRPTGGARWFATAQNAMIQVETGRYGGGVGGCGEVKIVIDIVEVNEVCPNPEAAGHMAVTGSDCPN